MKPVPLSKRLKRLLRFAAVRVLWAALGRLPLSWTGPLGSHLGALAFFLLRGERAKALRSLERALPELRPAERRSLARRCFQHLARCALELACIRQVDARIEQFVRWSPQDRQLLERLLARGKGLIFVSGHVGNWELLARRVALAGFPSNSIAKETSDPRMSRLIESLRLGGRVATIWRGSAGAARQMLRVLRRGEILGLVIDQDTQVQSVFVPFFGTLAATPRAAADLARRTGAPVIAGFCQRGTDGYTLSMQEIPLPSTGDDEADTLALTAALSAEIERAVRRAPEQWVWMHQRWKTRPMAALALSVLALWLGCLPSDSPRGDPPPPTRVILHGARIEAYRGSVHSMSGRAAQLLYDRASGNIEADEAFGRFLRSDATSPAGTLQLRTPVLTGNLGTKQADAAEPLDLQTDDGTQGRARNGHYDGVKMYAQGDGPVHLWGPTFNLTADRYAVDFTQDRFDFDGHVDAVSGGKR